MLRELVQWCPVNVLRVTLVCFVRLILTSVKTHLVLMVAPAQKRVLVSSVVNVCKAKMLFSNSTLSVIMVGEITTLVLAW